MVDDEPEFLDILSRELGHICTVHTARSGALALDTLARDSDIAVIICSGATGVLLSPSARPGSSVKFPPLQWR